ncbi:MAG: hypothetical protein K6A23_01800 [Butyrivibrio sp.]|nr:hypothetical protein [Butyrivibrio sp.]
MDISSLMSLSSLTNSTSDLTTAISKLTDSDLSGLSDIELQSLQDLTTSGISTFSGISNDTVKTATENFSTILKNTLEEVQETGTLSDETQEQLTEVVNVLQSSQADNSGDDNTAYQLYQELFNSAQGRKNVKEIVQSGFTRMIFDSGDVTTGLDNMSAMISALENTESTENK